MIKYDFDKLVSRENTNSSKWDTTEYLFGEKDIISMWVADMDLPIAKPITDAIRKRSEHEYYGYTISESKSSLKAVIQRMKGKFNWDVKPEWICITPGIVPALYHIIRAFTVPGDAVIHQDPVYYPFWSAIEANGCRVANNPLKLVDGRYEMDFENLKSQFDPIFRMRQLAPRVRMMILCNPHNPVGRVWTKDELIKMGEIVIGSGGIVVSDEIHCELLFKGYKHVPFAMISKEFEQNCVVCMAPSKTFNLAGLEASAIIIPNHELREKFKQTIAGFLPGGNIFGLTALEAAYNEGDEWLEQLLVYLQGNLNFLIDYFETRIPRIKVIKPEGTYLIWLDCRDLGMEGKQLAEFLNHQARVGLDHGFVFGPSGEGFERINIACPRTLLIKALKRIEDAVNGLGGK